MKRTQNEIDVQIAALKLERKSLPERSMFGTNNWSIIDATLDILEGRSDWDLTSDEAMEEFGDEGVMELEMVEAWMGGADCEPPCGDEELIAQAEKSLSK